MADLVNPLNDQHCACLDRAMQKSAELLTLIEACKDCGFDFDAAESEAKAIQERATALKRKFFPGRP